MRTRETSRNFSFIYDARNIFHYYYYFGYLCQSVFSGNPSSFQMHLMIINRRKNKEIQFHARTPGTLLLMHSQIIAGRDIYHTHKKKSYDVGAISYKNVEIFYQFFMSFVLMQLLSINERRGLHRNFFSF